MSGTEEVWAISVCVIIFGIIFYRIAPILTRKSRKVADNIGTDQQGVSPNDLIGGTIGLILGLVIAFLLTQIYQSVVSQKSLYLTITITIYAFLAFLGWVIGSKKGSELLNLYAKERKALLQAKAGPTEENAYGYNAKDKKTGRIPKILDTSVIIDGRIIDILKTGFLEGRLIVPNFVLEELQKLADSSDNLKRAKGRRGLDLIQEIQQKNKEQLLVEDTDFEDLNEVDAKLVKLAKQTEAVIITNDFNLNKVAEIQGVSVLNINDLANAIKPVVLPGEEMNVFVVKDGKENNQGVAYLEDGTMIVVEGGKKLVGENTAVVVTSVLQTSAGRMIFAKLK